jgi:hypothetical protein
MQDAQQHECDQGAVDLDAHGVFAAAEKAADLEVLLEPFEQQFDIPALFVELGDIDRGWLRVIGEQINRLVMIGADDDDLAQAAQPRPLREQQTLQMALASPALSPPTPWSPMIRRSSGSSRR